MTLAALDRKLLRETARLKGQIATIALVLAGGLACFIALRGTYTSLEDSCAAYYDRYRFAHVFAHLERAPESLKRRIEAIAGVANAETRISEEITLPMEGMARAAYARLSSLPASAAPASNALHLRRGRFPARGRGDEIVLLASFAEAHGLVPGDRLPAVVNGKLKQLRIVGLVLSPEFVYAIRPGALVDDPKRYAALWMERGALASAFQLEGAFNEVSLRLTPQASDPAVRAALDALLVPYGGAGAIARKDQISHRILTQELSQLEAIAGMVPAVFLGVAAFLVNLVLGRLIRLQRSEIAALKAIGYTNTEIGRHYLGLVVAVLVPGGVLGVLGGLWLGRRVFGLYESLFRFPEPRFVMSIELIVTGLALAGAAAATAAWLAVRAAVSLPPAEAMRPPAPARYRRGLADRLRVGTLFGTSALMVLREVERRPLRSLLSALGMAGALALIVLGHFGTDTLEEFLNGTYQREQRQDLTVTFGRPLSPRAVSELAALRGVLAAQGMRSMPARAAHEHRQRECLLIGLPEASSLRRLIERDGGSVSVPREGVLISRALAQALALHVGDRLELLPRQGERRLVLPLIVGLLDDTTGLSIYGSERFVATLQRDRGAVSSVLLSVQPEHLIGVEASLRRSPEVIDVSELRADVERLRDMNGAAMDIWTIVSITLGACMIFGVVYNNARISLETQSRELSSLRVLGFSRREISQILIGGLAIEVALALPLGLWLGRAWSELFMTSALDPETMRWAVVIAPRTYVLAAAVGLLAAAASALLVRRSLDRLDLIGVLKTRE